MRLASEKLNLNLRHTFQIAHGAEEVAENVLVRLRDGRHEGLGEASPKGYYGQNQAQCMRTLRDLAPRLSSASVFDLERILAALERRYPQAAGARAAVDIALHDLLGKRLGLPLWKYWGLDPTQTPQTSYTIGIDTLQKVREKIAEAARFPVLKIKLGVQNDMDIIQEVRRLCPKKTLRVDANCGWSVKEAIAKARVLERLGIEFIEQPVPAGQNAKLKRIQDRIGLPLVTDESSLVAADLPALRGCVKGINIKLVKCGGLREALKMIHTARACGLKIMLGCMIESSVMITAGAHLTPLVDWADLDGNVLITNDPFKGVALDKDARLILPKGPGLGLTCR